jgi:dephospho-CoA kinase
MKIIGVIGLNGSGKDEVINYLNKKHRTPLISVGDIIREIAAREGVEPTRDNLDEITRRYFKLHGQGYFLKQVVENIHRNNWQTLGISGIRSPEDIAILKEAFKKDFVLIHVYITDPRVRYDRVTKRGSKRDQMTCEAFLKQDEVSRQLFNIQEAIKLADYSIPNDGNLDDLHNEIIKLITGNKLLP